MRFLKRIAGFLGISKDEAHEPNDEHNRDEVVVDSNLNREETHHLPRKGFSVPVQVAIERPQIGPVLVPCAVGDGGVQGLKWYAKRLRIDEDGDVADEFLDEISPETRLSGTEDQQHQPFPRFEVKYSARPVKVKSQALTPDGRIQQGVEYQGTLQWV